MGGESHGPFEDVKVADGTVYADERAIARFDESTDTWQSALDGSIWPIVAVVAVRN